jgi:hypothetical protein
MKRFIFYTIIVLFFSVIAITSCQHLPPIDCSQSNFTVSATHTDATNNLSNGTISMSSNGGNKVEYTLNGGSLTDDGFFENLSPGDYTVIGTDESGCTDTAFVTIANLPPVNPCIGVTITVSATKTDPTTGQSNGSITASASGGSTTYTYSLNGGPFQSSGNFSGLPTGNYTIVAKNANGCTGSTTIALGATNPCNGVNIVVAATKVDPTTGQSNGSITANATGGGNTYTYSINGVNFQASGTFSGLAAGTYTLTAKNPNGCIGTTQITLVSVSPCTLVNITFTTNKVNIIPCPTNNGSITVSASGSSGYTYSKNGGTSYQAGNVFGSLTAGTYNIKVKDANGCTSNTTPVTLTQAAMGPNFNNVKTIILANCGNCHLNGGNDAGYNFDNDCSIVGYWSQIKGACVSPYTLTRMPRSGPLSATLQAQITAWINAGHRYTD